MAESPLVWEGGVVRFNSREPNIMKNKKYKYTAGYRSFVISQKDMRSQAIFELLKLLFIKSLK